MINTTGVLSGVKVLDLTWHIAGPFCTKILADYGADVIKVERPDGGDPARRLGPFHKDQPHQETSGLFLVLNTNKQGITLNLKTSLGKEIICELAKDADIVVESFRPGVMSRLGLQYETLEKTNPRLVMTSISNFGQSGPYRDFKASELVLFGMGNTMSSSGLPEREPVKRGAGTPGLFLAGNLAAFATMLAFYGSEIHKQGQLVDFSIFEAQIGGSLERRAGLLSYQYNGDVTTRSDPRKRSVYPSGIYRCSNGYWDCSAIGSSWPAVGKMMGMPDLIDDPRWSSAGAQAQAGHREEFMAVFLPWCLERTKQECVVKGQKAGVLCMPVNDMREVTSDPHLDDRGYWIEIDHPVAGRLKYPGAQIKADEMRCAGRKSAPLLGQDNKPIYCERLGYTKRDLIRLKELQVI
jgi:crotonobetainyl-CoA:carnitine CoA-transferase CaiB-like acyl-CoA transferase